MGVEGDAYRRGALLQLRVFTVAAAEGQRAAVVDLSWVRGANYVPSSSKNDVMTWLDYNSTLIHQEMAFAGKEGFNAVRVFLH